MSKLIVNVQGGVATLIDDQENTHIRCVAANLPTIANAIRDHLNPWRALTAENCPRGRWVQVRKDGDDSAPPSFMLAGDTCVKFVSLVPHAEIVQEHLTKDPISVIHGKAEWRELGE